MRYYFYLVFLALSMLLTGSLNSLSVKYMESLKIENKAGNKVPFNQPYLQCCGTFLGQLLCMGFYLFFVGKWCVKKFRDGSRLVDTLCSRIDV